MYRVVILFVVIIAVSAEDPGMKRKCMRIMTPDTFRCCDNQLDEKMMADEYHIKECHMMSHDPVSCEGLLCIAKKKGYATADDKIDMSKFEEIITKDLGNNKEFIEAFKSNCIDGDLNTYGPPDFCDFARMKNCVTVQYAQSCSSWKDTTECKGMKELVEECAKEFE